MWLQTKATNFTSGESWRMTEIMISQTVVDIWANVPRHTKHSNLIIPLTVLSDVKMTKMSCQSQGFLSYLKIAYFMKSRNFKFALIMFISKII